MSVTNRLVFNPADAASGSKVGSHVLAGDDGTAIGHVSDALKVNFSNTSIAVSATDLDIRDLAFATDSVTAYQGTDPWVVGDGGGSLTVDGTVAATQSGSWTVAATQSGSWSVGISGDVNVTQGTSPWVVSATDLDIRNLSHSQDSIKIGDGTDFLAVNNDGSINVAIASGFTDVDDSLANSAIFNEALAVSTTAISVTAAAAIAGRKWLYLANSGNKPCFFGMATGLTAANGFPLYPGQQSEFRVGASLAPKIIGAAGASSEDIRVMQLA